MKTKTQLPRYPWNRWMSRRRLRLRRGVHYQCMTHCMAVMVRNAAIARGRRASIATLQEDGAEILVVSLEDR